MAINPNRANSNDDISKFSQGAEAVVDSAFGRLGKLSVKDVLGFTTLERKLGKDIGEVILLDELINNLDRPILKGLLTDSIAVVSNWFEDPEVLCCLIQGIWAMWAARYSHTDLANLLKDGIILADTDFGKWLDVLIAFVDLIITFISADIKKLSVMIPDIIKEITNGVIGAVLLVLQEVLFALRDSAINYILQQIDRAKGLSLDIENIWAKCIPFAQFLDLLKRYLTDYGLFAELFEKIKGFIALKVGDFGYMKALDFPKSINDLEFLYWFRDLLIKLKQAAINFDLCVFYGSAAVTGSVDNQVPAGAEDDSRVGLPKEQANRPNPNEVQGIKVAADGTILRDANGARDFIPLIANSSIRTFLNKYYGYPLEIVDNLLSGSTSADSINGTDINSRVMSNLNADCPNTPTPQEVVKWALRIRNRNL